MKRQGLFSLQSSRDLLEKARYDLQRLCDDPLDAYAAFDFFVAIRHLPDWIYPGDGHKRERQALFDKHVEFRVARHIADGAKHFRATQRQHRQVAGTSAGPTTFQDGAFQSDGFQAGGLIVELDAQDLETLSLGRRVSAVTLARKVFAAAERVVV